MAWSRISTHVLTAQPVVAFPKHQPPTALLMIEGRRGRGAAWHTSEDFWGKSVLMKVIIFMKFIRNSLVLFVAVAALTVGGGLVAGTAAWAATTGGVSGKVVAATGGAPVSGATVFMHPRAGGPGGGTADSASDGSYSITGLAAGTYAVSIRAVAPYVHNYDAGDVTIRSGAVKSGRTLKLQLGGKISGLVTDSVTGAPIANAKISACVDEGDQCGDASTDAQGRYTLTTLVGREGDTEGLFTADYMVMIDARGYARLWWGATTPSGYPGALVHVKAGKTTSHIDGHMKAAH